MNSETPILQRIRLAVSARPEARIFRNNTGKLQDPRTGAWVPFGLCVGSSDLIGWRSLTVTPSMVGRRLAVFAAIEVKTATGRASPAQLDFIAAVQRAGGLAGIARSPEDAERIINGL